MKIKSRNSYTICYNTHTTAEYGQIQFYIATPQTVLAAIKKLEITEKPEKLSLVSKWIVPVKETTEASIELDSIISKCILICFQELKYFCIVSNQLCFD